MPYTAAQRRRFHAGAARGEPGMKRLAAEADAYARAGKEKPARKPTKASAGSRRTKKVASKKKVKARAKGRG